LFICNGGVAEEKLTVLVFLLCFQPINVAFVSTLSTSPQCFPSKNTHTQDPRIANSATFNTFLLAAQQETRHEPAESVSLDIYLMNEHKLSLAILTTEQTDSVLEKVLEWSRNYESS
jgi:hypothetical protein